MISGRNAYLNLDRCFFNKAVFAKIVAIRI